VDLLKKKPGELESSVLLDPQVFCCFPLGVLHNKKESDHAFFLDFTQTFNRWLAVSIKLPD
jgi:hypothetical protein